MAPNDEPVAVPLIENATVPKGVVANALVSTTVAVQLEVPPTTMVDGLQATVVVVEWAVTVIAKAVVVELPACAVSVVAGVYAALTLALPEPVPVNVAVHVAVPTGLVP